MSKYIKEEIHLVKDVHSEEWIVWYGPLKDYISDLDTFSKVVKVTSVEDLGEVVEEKYIKKEQIKKAKKK